MPEPEVIVDPGADRWREMATRGATGALAGEPMANWARRTREELGLPVAQPIVATGHQTLLWHPGILAKYLAVEAVTAADPRLARANLIVDQHADDFGALDVPVRRGDGTLAVTTIALAQVQPGVPMGRHPSFEPPPLTNGLVPALPSVAAGLEAIRDAVRAHRTERNAALQMAAALEDLMHPWIHPSPRVCASDLMNTSLARTLIGHMVEDPTRCANAYNDAIAAFPDVQIGPLVATSQRVEMPLWKLGGNGRREHAADSDAKRWLGGDDAILLPRALFLTALVRLGMCDLFVHGTGGASYDRVMERWLGSWLDLQPAPMAVVTATVRLPFDEADGPLPSPQVARHALRRVWHDPASDGARPSRWKASMLQQIAAAPWRSTERQQLFDTMHERLGALRSEREEDLAKAHERLDVALRRSAESAIRMRRTWAFPLYPQELIEALRARIGNGR